MSFQPSEEPEGARRFSRRILERTLSNQTVSPVILGQPYPPRGRSQEPQVLVASTPPLPAQRRSSASRAGPSTTRSRRPSLTVLAYDAPPKESASTFHPALAHPRPVISSATARPQLLSTTDLSNHSERPSSRVRLPGGIEDFSVNLPDPPDLSHTGPQDPDLFSESVPLINPPLETLHSVLADEPDTLGEIILPETFQPGHATTQDLLSPVQEEELSRAPSSNFEHLSPPTPAQRSRPATPSRTHTPTPPATPPPAPARSRSLTPPTLRPNLNPNMAPTPGPNPAVPQPGPLPQTQTQTSTPNPIPDLADPDTHPAAGPNPTIPGSTMPFPGDRRAPTIDVAKDPAGIPLFFDKVRLLGRSAGLLEQQMITWARFYAPPDDQQLWLDIPQVVGNDFQAFRDAALKLYPNASARYTIGDLYNLVNSSRSMMILNTAALGEYQRNFQRVSSHLIKAGMISTFEQRRLFREGLHPMLNKDLDLNLRFVQHDHPVGVPWDIEVVVQELQRILTGGHLSTADPNPIQVYSTISGFTPFPQVQHSQTSFIPGAPTYGTVPQPQQPVKTEEPWVALLLQELRALKEATERSAARSAAPSATVPRASRPTFGCAICSSKAHMTRECPTKMMLIQKGYAITDSRGNLAPKEGFLPRGESGMTVLDRFNKLFMENPNMAPIGATLPIQPIGDVPPRIQAPRQDNMYQTARRAAVMYNVGAVRLCPKGDPKGLGCSTPKRKRAFDNLVIQRRTGSDLCTTRWMGRE